MFSTVVKHWCLLFSLFYSGQYRALLGSLLLPSNKEEPNLDLSPSKLVIVGMSRRDICPCRDVGGSPG